MEQVNPLRNAASTFLNGAGDGTVRFGPGRPGLRWVIRRISVQTSTSTLVPEARIYRGGPGDASFLSGTFVGSFDTDDGLEEVLQPGEVLTVVWTGGDPGASATASYFGDEISGRA